MSKEVLFVDDDPTTTAVTRLLLEKVGYTVTTASNGLEALQKLEQKHYPLVITDWEMPEMDGAELCKLIRRQYFGGYVYTMLLTRRGDRENLLEGLECGADDYLTKPVDEGELLARLQTGRRITSLEHRLRTANEEALRMSMTDALTSTFNRRYLMKELPSELERARREGSALSVIMCDVDHFKKINDRYGHSAGDLVLVTVADVVRSSCRPKIDWVARYGGEEFILVLPATPLAGAQVVAERIRKRLESTLIEGERHSVLVTASFGVVSDLRRWPSPALDADRFLACADRCLYESKKRGRNQVTCWEETERRELSEAQAEPVVGQQSHAAQEALARA